MMNSNPICITLFYCNNSILQEELIKLKKDIEGVALKTISIPCSGKVDLLYLLKAIETGADGVLLITCKYAECHYLEGNLRAKKRVAAVNSILKESGIKTDRIKYIQQESTNTTGFLKKEIINFYNNLTSQTKEKSTLL